MLASFMIWENHTIGEDRLPQWLSLSPLPTFLGRTVLSAWGQVWRLYCVKNPPSLETQETWVWSLSQEDPLEKGEATHSIILAWRIPWTEEPGELQSMELQRVRQNWVTFTSPISNSHALWVLNSKSPQVLKHTHAHTSRLPMNTLRSPSRSWCCHWCHPSDTPLRAVWPASEYQLLSSWWKADMHLLSW